MGRNLRPFVPEASHPQHLAGVGKGGLACVTGEHAGNLALAGFASDGSETGLGAVALNQVLGVGAGGRNGSPPSFSSQYMTMPSE